MATQDDPPGSNSGPLPMVPSITEALSRLREENARLRAELATVRASDGAVEHGWREAIANGITYADDRSATSSLSSARLLAQLAGVSKERMKAGRIRNSSVGYGDSLRITLPLQPSFRSCVA